MTADSLLLRQVHPNFIKGEFVSSIAFRPNEADAGCMSVYDGDLISPAAAWEHYTTVLAKKSAGVVALSVKECESQSLKPRPDPEPFPEHAVIDFTDVNPKQWEKKVCKKLQAFAAARGWLHRVG